MDGSKDTGVLASRQADESEGKHSEWEEEGKKGDIKIRKGGVCYNLQMSKIRISPLPNLPKLENAEVCLTFPFAVLWCKI